MKDCASRIVLLFVFLLLFSIFSMAQVTISSPDNTIRVQVTTTETGQINYEVWVDNKQLLKPSSLGLQTNYGDFSRGMKQTGKPVFKKVDENYKLVFGKKRDIKYQANEVKVDFQNLGGSTLEIIFRVSNDGMAFRYRLRAGNKDAGGNITKELTSFHFPAQTRGWLQPMQVAKTGWEQTNPAYEEHYVQDVLVGTPSPSAAGWVYPALFKCDDVWALITEAGVGPLDCATRLQAASPDGEYFLGFPDEREVITGLGLLPVIRGDYQSPWRIVTIGSLATIAASTLGTDLALPQVAGDFFFVKPGKASWSWINSKDDFIVYDEQKKYIDYAADMRWQYCLIDAAWDTKIGYDKVKELADYGRKKNVALLLWYNSAGDWNTVKYTPKDMLLTRESRRKEFARLREMGIAGVKIDFFAGDGQSVMAYYHDILKDAADYKLLVNFHGATLPRGWSRTYPHLVTVEAVRGFEMVTFGQGDANRQATHCTILPFTRNAFDPMDFTPMNLYKINTRVVRKTSPSFELALSVLFLSGIQHYAESPEGMEHVPEYVQDLLRTLPDSWEEVKLLDGYPGSHVVMARRSGKRWYIAGINGSKDERAFTFNHSDFGGKIKVLIADGIEPNSFAMIQPATTGKQSITLKPSGGFVVVVE